MRFSARRLFTSGNSRSSGAISQRAGRSTRIRRITNSHEGVTHMTVWDPGQYLRYGDERLRPGFDLLGRVGELPPGDLWDLGCGTGAHLRAIAASWPGRR